MRLISWAALIASGVAITTVAVAQQAPQALPPVPAQAVPAQVGPAHDDPNEVICHPGEPILGSRLSPVRICRTRREWDQIRRDSASVLFQQQMERSSNCMPHGLC